jgi:ribosome-associated protein
MFFPSQVPCGHNESVEDLAVTSEIRIPAHELSISFARSGGPGGQNVNKVETKVELRWTPGESIAFTGAARDWLLQRLTPKLTSAGELIVTSSRTRDQLKNREDALAKLAETVRQALVRPKKRRKTKPTAAAKRRRLEAKKQRSRVKKNRLTSPREE